MDEQWTFATLKALIEARFAHVFAVLDERAKAIEVAFANFKIRMDGTNEWRGAFDDLTKTMASQSQLGALKERVEKLEDAQLTTGGKALGYGHLSAVLLAAIGASGTLFAILFTFMK